MALEPGYIRTAQDTKLELKSNDVSPADFYSIINYDNIRILINKVEKLEEEIKKIK